MHFGTGKELKFYFYFLHFVQVLYWVGKILSHNHTPIFILVFVVIFISVML